MPWYVMKVLKMCICMKEIVFNFRNSLLKLFPPAPHWAAFLTEISIPQLFSPEETLRGLHEL